MLRRAWKPLVGTAVLVGVPSYIYRRYSSRSETFDLSIRERGPDGKSVVMTRSFPLLSKEQTNARLSEHAATQTTTRPDGMRWNHATAHLASNSPIEDAHASAIIPRDPTDPASPGDFLFFTVMDGHGGPHTSKLLSNVLIPAITLELYQRMKDSSATSQPTGMMEWLKSLIYPSAATPSPFDADPSRVSRAFQDAFLRLDTEIVNAPLRLLAEHIDKLDIQKNAIPDLSQHPMAMASMLPALSGSCAIMAMFDTARQHLYVACTGDSRAVAGVYEEAEDGRGTWRVQPLSEDQTGRNPAEVKRIQSEHPPDEADTVVMRGRVLGGLEPTRAFGDARYKWPREVQAILNEAFLKGNNHPMRSTPSLLKTPPYVTAQPFVVQSELPFRSRPDQPTPSGTKSTLRFLVLATDGLWDELSSEEVVALVGGHLAGLKGTIPKSSLPGLVPMSSNSQAMNGKNKHRSKDAEKGSWAFVDDNVGTHLIRNALGRGDEEMLRQLVSIPAPHSRSYRDDITVTVVWWQDGRENEAKADTFKPEQKLKSKL
ncbi:uncharacterized protein FIBRA_02697 [Fibroporia radiculosa]|uniref:PPM-type phosphatase domain-containing protein n=1 Tax=Fibroporia radiculosa TaxID=599839 RepID=J4H200_9APHY|nr:uncharacterized protein FIBRA_02697 [Fibroporia radiculosa]CCM00659.1 predicted protein [Fibroporia radiculosa]